MHAEQIRQLVLTLEGVEETFPFDEVTLVFKVKGKMFLLLALDAIPLQFNVKCNPDRAVELRDQYPSQILPGYHMNKKHWNTIVCDGCLPTTLLKSMILDSYALVTSKSISRKQG